MRWEEKPKHTPFNGRLDIEAEQKDGAERKEIDRNMRESDDYSNQATFTMHMEECESTTK